MIKTHYEHIMVDDAGRPLIAGTTMKVEELVVAHTVWGWSAEELHQQYPHLSWSQIYSALAYYWDHQAALDADLAQWQAFEDQVQQLLPPVPLIQRLHEQGLL